jgi:hypothetical protein
VPKVFDYVNDILYDKKNIMFDKNSEKEYSPYLTNKALSQHRDCLSYAQAMNERPWLDKKLQYLYLINIVRSMKRQFHKWDKPEKIEDIECVKTFYGYSDTKAREALQLLSEEQIQKIKEQTEIGGLRKQND